MKIEYIWVVYLNLFMHLCAMPCVCLTMGAFGNPDLSGFSQTITNYYLRKIHSDRSESAVPECTLHDCILFELAKHVVYGDPQHIEDTFPLAVTYNTEPKQASARKIVKYVEQYYAGSNEEK